MSVSMSSEPAMGDKRSSPDSHRLSTMRLSTAYPSIARVAASEVPRAEEAARKRAKGKEVPLA